MQSAPLVSVICLCFNHREFVSDAIYSVLNQTYEQVELIIVDDASTDGSQDEIRKTIKGLNVNFIALDSNVGNCTAFNIGFAASKGEYIIDLSADDLLLPSRIELGINDFSNADEKSGVHFSDAFLTDESGSVIKTHFERDASGNLTSEIPKGDIYNHLIVNYFICPPTMMIRRAVLEKLNGYDEDLKYEDFDFWIRSSRHFDYLFNKAPLVKKRIIRNSHAQSQNEFFNAHQASTLAVCQKILVLNVRPQEYLSLISRAKYEIKQCLKTLNFLLIPKYIELMKKSRLAYRRLSSSSNMDR